MKNPVVFFMARWQTLWVLYLSVGALFVLPLFLLEVLHSIARHLYGSWCWTWKYELADAVKAFTPQHRRSLRSLALKPAATGTLVANHR